MNQMLDQKITAYLEDHRQEMIDDVRELVNINSVDDKEHAAPGAPFGPGVAKCLDVALAQCEKAGMTTRNFGGYAGDAAVQSASALFAIKALYTWVPMILIIVGTVILAMCNLDKIYPTISKELAARRQQ